MEWHATDVKVLFEALNTSGHGLSDEEVRLRQEKHGLNVLPAAKPITLLEVVINQFKSPIIYILLIAAIVALLIDEEVDAIFIFAVLLLNALIGTIQEWKAERNAASLQNLLQIKAHVIRDGTEISIPAEELVPGDVVVLESGLRIPADIRLTKTYRLQVDESLLTGESTVVTKNTDLIKESLSVNDRKNMVFAGSTIMSGRGTGIVVETGINTQVGKIAKTVSQEPSAKTPLVIRMERFSRQISYIVLVAVVLLAIIGLYKGMPVRDLFFLAVALAVSAIPEGLPVAITVALSIATSRMAKQNVIIRKLTAVEALGSVTKIASDKTGTLTVNKQTVKKIALPYHVDLSVTGEGYNAEGKLLARNEQDPEPEILHLVRSLATNAILCSEGSLFKKNEEWKFSGDAMDLAIFSLGYKMGLPPAEVREKSEIVAELPYEPVQKYAAAFVLEEKGVKLVIKGAFEVIFRFCDRVTSPQGELPLDYKVLRQQVDTLVGEGYRVLAVASGPVEKVLSVEEMTPDRLQHLSFQGLLGFVDPLRPEAKKAVDECQKAGVEVCMVTGDHPVTAFGIARELGIVTDLDRVITGTDMKEFISAENPEFISMISSARVFARVEPLQKFQLVQGLKNAGHFVAVTGDGVNDVPALKEANIGLAMGSGTDLAKDTASIIIADDNFETIKNGIEQGRFAYDNIRKVTYLLIATGGAELLLFMLAISFGLPLPLLPVQLLWLNLVTNGIQDVALAFEAGEKKAMRRPPRDPRENIFNEQMISQVVVSAMTIGLVAFGVWEYLLNAGYQETEARNILLLLMVLMENVHAFNCRSETRSVFRIPLNRNYILIFGVLAAQGIHILSMQLPFMQKVLNVQPVNTTLWITLLLLSLLLLLTVEIFKAIRRRRRKKAKQHT